MDTNEIAAVSQIISALPMDVLPKNYMAWATFALIVIQYVVRVWCSAKAGTGVLTGIKSVLIGSAHTTAKTEAKPDTGTPSV